MGDMRVCEARGRLVTLVFEYEMTHKNAPPKNTEIV